jgi:hypothetical protein
MLIAALSGSAPAGDPPPNPGNCIELEIERDTGNTTAPPILDEATLKKFQEWRYKPEKVRRPKVPMMFQPIPPAVPNRPTLI